MQVKTSYIIISAALALVAMLTIIWQLIVYAQAAPPANQFPIMVAVIALIGTLWTGAIGFAGLLLKDSIDRRNSVLQAESNQRQAILQAESEKRLRMEAAIKAIELMSTAETEGVPIQESREAAILVISSLNQPRLALTMADQLLRRGKISAGSLVQVATLCLNSDDPVLQRDAAVILKLNSEKLVESPNELEFPFDSMQNWTGTLANVAKENLLLSLAISLLSKDFSYWNVGVICNAIYSFYKVFMNEDERRYKYVAALFAKEFCLLLGYGEDVGLMPPDRHRLPFGEILQAADEAMKPFGGPEDNIGSDDLDLVLKIRGWKTAAMRPVG